MTEIQTGYTIGNALGRLNSDRPRLADRCVTAVPYARLVRHVLQVLDMYAQQSGKGPEQVAQDVQAGRIHMRSQGNTIVLTTP